jgi:toxin ParE1/3/4
MRPSPPSGGNERRVFEAGHFRSTPDCGLLHESDDVAVGEKIASAVRDLVSRIAEAPQWGRPVLQRPGVRVVLLVRYRYKVFYRVTGTAVRIIHIRHMSRRPWPPT